jgi:Ser/Thr protein kinase RdoA (MazF antagonist)
MRRVANAALTSYDVGPARLSLIAHLENTTFRVDAAGGRRFLLRIHRTTGSPWHPRRSAAEVRSELQWLHALRATAGLPVPEPVPARDGSPLAIVEVPGLAGPRVCVLFRWLTGRFLNTSLTPTHLERVGRAMARLHAHATSFRPPPGFVRWRREDLTEAVCAPLVRTVGRSCGAAAADLVVTVVEGVRRAQEAIGSSREAYGLIHGDLHQENYLFARGHVGIIDFDDCGWGHLLADFATTLSELDDRSGAAELRAGLLRGYCEIRPLPAGFDEHLPAFLALRQLQLTLWVIEQRDHPAFERWEADAHEGLDALRALVPRLG